MTINIDASRHLKCSASCCEVLYSAESHPLEGIPWHLGVIDGTSEYGIIFQRGTLSSISLGAFADADYASKATNRRSVSDGVIIRGGASVCWFSRTQKCVTLSTSLSRVHCSRGRCKGVIAFETVLAFCVAQ